MIQIYGASDDLIEIEGCEGEDEFGSYSRHSIFEFTTPAKEGFCLYGEYAPEGMPDGVWVFGFAPLREDVPIPDWPMRMRLSERGYSPLFLIEAPDDVVCRRVHPPGGDDD